MKGNKFLAIIISGILALQCSYLSGARDLFSSGEKGHVAHFVEEIPVQADEQLFSDEQNNAPITKAARASYVASISRCRVTLSLNGTTYTSPATLTMRVGEYYNVNRTGDYGAVITYGNALVDGDQQYVPYFLWWSKDSSGNPVPQTDWQFGIRSTTVLRQSVTDNITLYVRFKRQYWSSSAQTFVDDGTTADVPFQIRYTALPNVTPTPTPTPASSYISGPQLKTPSTPKVTAISGGLKLTWNKDAYADYYTIYRKKVSSAITKYDVTMKNTYTDRSVSK